MKLIEDCESQDFFSQITFDNIDINHNFYEQDFFSQIRRILHLNELQDAKYVRYFDNEALFRIFLSNSFLYKKIEIYICYGMNKNTACI